MRLTIDEASALKDLYEGTDGPRDPLVVDNDPLSLQSPPAVDITDVDTYFRGLRSELDKLGFPDGMFSHILSRVPHTAKGKEREIYRIGNIGQRLNDALVIEDIELRFRKDGSFAYAAIGFTDNKFKITVHNHRGRIVVDERTATSNGGALNVIDNPLARELEARRSILPDGSPNFEGRSTIAVLGGNMPLEQSMFFRDIIFARIQTILDLSIGQVIGLDQNGIEPRRSSPQQLV